MSTASFLVTGALGEAVLALAADAILIVDDVSWRVVASNAAAVAFYGAPLVGVALENLFTLDGERAVERTVWQAQTSDEPVEIALERADGARRYVRVRAKRLELDGCTVCVLALGDVSREREVERELESTRAEQRELLDTLGIGVLTLDSSGRVLAHNRFEPLERAHGANVVGRNFFFDIAVSTDTRAVFQRFQHWAHGLDVPTYREVFAFELGRAHIEAELHAGTGVSGGDALVRLADATDRYNADQELRRQTFQAEEAARRTRLVYQTASLIHRSLDLDEVLETAVAETGRLLGASRCQVVEIGLDGRIRISHEYLRGGFGAPAEIDATLESSPAVAEAVRALHPLAIESAEGHPLGDARGLLAASGSRAVLVAPIAVRREARGVLAIHQCDRTRRWTSGEVELAASIASQVGLAIGHVEIHERVRRQAERETIVGRLAVAIHAADTLDAALGHAAVALLGLPTVGRCVVVCGAADGGRKVWAWRRDRGGEVAAEPAPVDPAAASDCERLTASFSVRDERSGFVSLECEPGTDAEEVGALLEAVAVHVGLAVGAWTLLGAITAAKRVWEGTFDAMSDGIVIHDEEFRVLRVNRAFATLARSKPPRLVGVSFLGLLSPANRDDVIAARDRVAETRRSVGLDIDEPALGGTLSISVSRLEGPEPCYIHTVRDVTGDRQMRERLAQSSKMASIGHLAAGVAHEINTPLATIAGSAQSLSRQLAAIPELRESARWPQVSDRLEAIVEQSFRCKRITHDLLNYAAPTRPVLAPTDLGVVTREAVEAVERERPAGRVRVRESGQGSEVETDPGLLRQVLINLVANALDAVDGRPNGRVTVDIRRLQREARISVRDTGSGIAAADLERVFDPFFTTKPPGRGTGLGLSITQSIVASLGGRIDVESREGRGSTFTVRLPREGANGRAARED